jgi:carbon-monoxide dehydrogenase small subunit
VLIEFQLNGQGVTCDAEADTRLLTLLREQFGLVGAKPGCEVGRCGACMVWLDGEPVNACLVMAWQLAGRSVTTIEALANCAESIPVRDALASCGAVQCGYCSAGMMMTMTYLYTRTSRPDAREAQDLMCGNLCRCTGYGGVKRAIEVLFEPPAP